MVNTLKDPIAYLGSLHAPLKPGFVEARKFCLGRAHAKKGLKEKAMDQFEIASKSSPDGFAPWGILDSPGNKKCSGETAQQQTGQKDRESIRCFRNQK